MDRLTEKRQGQWVIPLRQDGKHLWSLCSAGMGDASSEYLYGEYADRLAAYEDIGLEPEEIEKILERGTPLEGGTAELMKEYLSLGSIDHLRELVRAEQDGRPKGGDTVWTKISIWMDQYGWPDGPYPVKLIFIGEGEVSTFLPDRPYPGKVIFVGVGEKRACFHVRDTSGHIIPFDFKQIGKTVFLTREEAEAALKGGAE